MQTETIHQSASHFNTIQAIRTYLNQRIVGQEKLIERLLIALLTDVSDFTT